VVCLFAMLRAKEKHSGRQQPRLVRVGGGFSEASCREAPASTHPSTVFLLNPDRDAGEQSYIDQADPSMQTVEALAARAMLRTHPAVIDSALRLAHLLYSRDPSTGEVPRWSYVRAHIAMCRVLAPALTPAASLEAISAEWCDDARGAEQLDEPRQVAAVFEIVDQWCPGLSVESYVSFLDALAVRALAQMDPPPTGPGGFDRAHPARARRRPHRPVS
jgi:hypothetical protein